MGVKKGGDEGVYFGRIPRVSAVLREMFRERLDAVDFAAFPRWETR